MVLSILGPARWRLSHLHRVVALGITPVSLSNTFTGIIPTYSHVCRFGVRCSHSGSIGNCAGPPAHQPFIYIPRATTTTTMLLVLLPPPSRCCQVRGRRRGRWGEWGLETVRLAGWVVRPGGGAAGMTKCSRGMQGAGTRRNQGSVDEQRGWHQKQLRHTVLQHAGRRGANSSGLSLDSEDEQGSQLEDERSSQSQSCSMSVSGSIDIHFCQKIQHWYNFKKRFLKALLRKTTPSGERVHDAQSACCSSVVRPDPRRMTQGRMGRGRRRAGVASGPGNGSVAYTPAQVGANR